MSWRGGPDGAPGFELLSNRDERRTRAKAEPPRRHEGDGVAWLAPVDADAGGTWIGVNDRGVALTLLNLYEADAPGRGGARSRGLLTRDLLTSTSGGEVAARLAALDLSPYRPFTLLALDARGGELATVRRWDGVALVAPAPVDPPLLTSSGFDAAGADAARRRLWRRAAERGALDAAALGRLHRSHRPRRGPYSPCMHRPDAVTVSFTWVTVGAGVATLRYAAGAPCRTPLGPAWSLPLVA